MKRREDLELNDITFADRSSRLQRQRRWHAVLVLAGVLVVAVVLAAVVGLVAGLGVVRSEESAGDGSSVSADPDATSSDVVPAVMLQNTRCPVHPFPSPLPFPLPEKLRSAISAVEDQFTQLLDTKAMPGMVASIVYRDQELWSKGFGVTQTGPNGITPTKDTIYRIASVSKIFPVLLVYQLYERGFIRSLDDPLNNFCPHFSIDNPFTADNVTLRQIITSMSGLPREAPCQPEDPTVNLCPHNTTTILERLSSQSTILPPWTQPSYSNLGFALLGRCLVPHFFPHMTYEQYAEQHLLKPLGMTSTGFTYTHSSVTERLASGYLSDGSVEPVYNIGWWAPAGQMYSTIQDMNKLAHFFYSVGGTRAVEDPVSSDVLSPTLRRMMLLPTYTNRDQETGVGSPWEIQFQNNYTVVMKAGNLRGYAALFSFVPDLHLGVNILFSGAARKFSAAQEAYARLLPAFVEALTVSPTYPLPPNTTIYTGLYTALRSSGEIAIAQIQLYDHSLVLSGSAFSGLYLAYREPHKFQIDFSDDAFSCLSTELLALRHTWLYFDPPSPPDPFSSGQATSFTMPGFSPDLHFKRI